MTAIADMGIKDAAWRRFRLPRGQLWPLIVLLCVILLVATPLVFLVLGSFSTATVPGDFSFATLGLANYREV